MQRSKGVRGLAALWLVVMIGCVVEEPEEAPREGPPIGPPGECDALEDCPPGADCGCEPVRCAGLLGLSCPLGQDCVDDPRDDCDPRLGGADCWGLCVDPVTPPVEELRAPSWAPARCDDPARSYVSHDLSLCAQILYLCAPDWRPFYDACGCGCVRP